MNHHHRIKISTLALVVAIFSGYTGAIINKDKLIQGPPKPTTRFKRHGETSMFRNFTRLIDSMLDPAAYDMKLRPDFGGKPTEVTVSINVRSMGPISELHSIFQMDCYFRTTWHDKRLKYSRQAFNKSMLLNTAVLRKMWSPDMYFTNGRKSYLHTITVPNMYVRIDNDGLISVSQRLTIRSICPMNLKQYPLDYQTCDIKIGSFGYTNNDVLLKWKTGNNDSVELTENITMSQFTLLSVYVQTYNHSRMNNNDLSTILKASFNLKRETGYYLLNIYIPCSMLVALSWVTFWLNREASAARVSLGILTVLTTVTIGLSGRSDIPKLDYITALDLYILMSQFYVLAAFVTYASVNYFTKITKPDDCKPIYAFRPDELVPPSPPPRERMPKRNCMLKFLFCILGHVGYKAKLKEHKSEMNSVSKIDVAARFIFPASFIILNIVYWFSYGSITIDLDGH